MAEAFAKEYVDMIGRKPSATEYKMAELNLDPASDARAIRKYIGALPEFTTRYGEIVKKIYSIASGKNPGPKTVAYYVNRFTDPSYRTDDIADDIAAGSADHEGDAEEIQPVQNATQSMISFAKHWKASAGRKIDVYEFIRYYGQTLSPSDVRGIVEREKDSLLFVDKMHRDYLGRGVGEDEFWERYMFDHDSASFHHEVIAAVLASEEYRGEMAKQLGKRYHDMFGAALHPEDLEHVLFQVRAKSLTLACEEIDDELVKVSDELRSIGEWADSVYNDVLRRPADPADVRECVAEYRAHGARDAEAALRRRLYQSLEFHDVIKEHIVNSLELAHGRKPNKREVYEALTAAIKRSAGDMSRAISDFDALRT